MTRITKSLTALTLAGGLIGAVPASAQDENVMIVFDGSNSMWGQIDGTAKIEIARNVMDNLLGDWAETRNVGLMAYGHRRRGDCSDIEILVQPGADTRAGILDRIGAITPTGKTPLTSAIEQAATSLSYTDMPATVVLISDGLESCERDPCAVSQTLEQAGIGFTAHVVGFGLSDADAGALSCIAENTGGQYLSARNADELGAALSAVGSAVAAAPEPEPEPEPEPKYDVTLTAPDTALAGSAFEVSWTGAVSSSDFITVVPAGSDEGIVEGHVRVRDDSEDDLRAPGQTGLYEVRYVLEEGRRTLASQRIEVTEPEVTLAAPNEIRAGSAFPVTWTGTVSRSDYITIVPMGAKVGARETHFRVRDDTENDLTAPTETGFYEIRYVLEEGRRTLAMQPIEVLAEDATLERGASLDAPETAAAGSTITVGWTVENESADQRITVARADQAIFTWVVAVKLDTPSPLEITLPEEPGSYELRLLDLVEQEVLVRQPIQID